MGRDSGRLRRKLLCIIRVILLWLLKRSRLKKEARSKDGPSKREIECVNKVDQIDPSYNLMVVDFIY